ncbi:MAG: hypothetical protein ACRCYU_05175 [Nocardioides sp.]
MTEHGASGNDDAEAVNRAGASEAGSVNDELGGLWLALLGMVGEVHTSFNSVAVGCNGWSACPLCRLRSLAEHCSPEVTEHVSAAARSVLAAISAAVAPVARSDEHRGFEHIDLSSEGEPGATVE